jgi:hypothetical protein
VGQGSYGVPVAGGADLDKDGQPDYALAAMTASPQSRVFAGQVFVVFGDGGMSGTIDTSANNPRVLEIHGDQAQENAGSEIWMGDVTGDGFGDLVVCRQNYSPDGSRIGAGAMTLIPAQPELRDMAAANEVLDLRAPPEGIELITIHGANAYDRLCIWARNGDVTGDGIDDLAIGADGEASTGDFHAGAVYLVRGGDWLSSSQTIDLAEFGTVAAGKLARVKPSLVNEHPNAEDYHFGATLTLADLDGNGKAELMAAAALNRAGAQLRPAGGVSANTHASGGTDQGTLFIAWDDNFTGSWIPAPDFAVASGAGSYTILDGGYPTLSQNLPRNRSFGEEVLGGEDYDNDGKTDLFVGDLVANGYGTTVRNTAGLGHVIYGIAQWKDQFIDLDDLENPPEGFAMASFLGPVPGAIAGDTAMHGDFNGDGISDLAFSSPHDDPFARTNAGTLHILLGKEGRWPEFSDLAPANFPDSTAVQAHEIYGAEGAGGGAGDVLCYSAASADMNGDGVPDLIINEMQGDGSAVNDVGNLLIINSRKLFRETPLFRDGFEAAPP